MRCRKPRRRDNQRARSHLLFGILLLIVLGALPGEGRQVYEDLKTQEKIRKLEHQLMRTVEVARKIEADEIRAHTLRDIARVFAGLGQMERATGILGEALDAVERISCEWTRDKMLVGIAMDLAEVSVSERAVEVAERILKSEEKSEYPNRYASGAALPIAKVLAKVGTSERATALAEEVLKSAERIGSYDVRAETLFWLAWAFVRLGQSERAIEIAGKALQSAMAIKEDTNRTVMLSEIAVVFVKAGQPERAIEIAEKALQSAERVEENIACANLLGKVAVAFAKAGALERAVEIAEKALQNAERIERKPEQESVLEGIAVAFAWAEDAEKALKVVKQISWIWIRDSALNRVMEVLVEVGAIKEALNIAEITKDSPTSNDRLRLIATTAVRTGAAQELLKAIEEIEGEQNRTSAMKQVATVLAETGEVEKALKIIDQIKDISYIAPVLRRAVASGKVEEIEKILKIAEGIKSDLARTTALIEIAVALESIGQRARAIEILNKAMKTAEEVEHEKIHDSILSATATALADFGYVERPTEWAEKALSTAKRIKDDRHRIYTLLRIAVDFVELGQSKYGVAAIQEVVKTAERVGTEEDRMYNLALEELSAFLAWLLRDERGVWLLQGEHGAEIAGKVLEFAEHAQQDWLCLRLLTQIAPALARAGWSEQALKIVERIANEEDPAHPYNDASVLSSMTVVLVETGQLERAVMMAARALQTARERESFGRFSIIWALFEEMANAFARVGAIEEALRVAESIDDDSLQNQCLAQLAIACARAGSAEEAVKIAKRVRKYYDYGLLPTISGTLAIAGEVEKALQVANGDSQALLEIVVAPARTGAIENALKNAERIEDEETRSIALGEVAKIIADTIKQLQRQGHQLVPYKRPLGFIRL